MIDFVFSGVKLRGCRNWCSSVNIVLLENLIYVLLYSALSVKTKYFYFHLICELLNSSQSLRYYQSSLLASLFVVIKR